MPRYDHFLTKDEQAQTWNAHTKLQGADAEWLQQKCQAMTNSLGYRLTARASVDSALRLFLIADKNYTLEQALHIKNLPADQLKPLFEEFFSMYGDEKRTSEQNLALLGDMHRRAFEAIGNFRLPDYSNIRKLEDMYDAFVFINGLGSMETDYLQDIDQLGTPEHFQAYYNGAGGRANIERFHGNLKRFSQALSEAIPYIDHPEKLFSPDKKAKAFQLCRDQLRKVSGKRISEVDHTFSSESTAILSGVQEIQYFPIYQDPDDVPTKGMKEYEQYLAGRRNDLPASPEVDEYIRDLGKDLSDDEIGAVRKDIQQVFQTRPVNFTNLLNGIDPVRLEDPDLLNVSPDQPDKQKFQDQLQRIYYQLFQHTFYNGAMYRIYDEGYDEFDLIQLRGGESVRELVNRKYPGSTEKQKYMAMVMEASRHAVTDGVRLRDLEADAQGNLHWDQGFVISPKKQEEIQAEELSMVETGLTATREARTAMFMPEGNPVAVDQLTPEQLHAADEMFGEIYGTTLGSLNHRLYGEIHPEMTVADYFRVGGVSLRSYLGEERLQALSAGNGEALKAEILRMGTDPAVALSFTPINYDAQNDTYSFRNPVHILDSADKERIMATNLHLRSVEKYKEWMRQDRPADYLNALDDRMWNDMYQQEFHRVAKQGLIPADRITSMEELQAAAEDPEIPMTTIMNSVETLYGPKPKFVKEWTGSSFNDEVYTSADFQKYMNDLSQGDFTDKEFSIVAYIAALSPKVVTGNPDPGTEDFLDHDTAVRGKSTMWTNDLCVHYPKPREKLGTHHFELAIKPARDKAAGMIADFEAGNAGEMAEILAEGLRDIIQSSYAIKYPEESKGSFAFNLQVIQNADRLLERKPALKDAVYRAMDQLDPGLRDEMRAMLSLKQVMDDSIHAKARLARADREGVPVTPDERSELDKKINAFSAYVMRWKECVQAYENDPVHKAAEDEIQAHMMETFSQHPTNQAIIRTSMPKMIAYRQKHMRFPEDVKQSLLAGTHDEFGKNLENAVNRLRNYFEQNLQRYHQACEILGDGPEVYREDLSAKKCMEETRARSISKKHLEDMTLVMQSRMSDTMRERIMNRFNEKAAEKGWARIGALADLREKGKAMKPDNEERFKAYFDLAMEELRREPYRLAGIDQDLDKIRHAGEKTFEENLTRPMQTQVNAVRNLINGGQDERQKAKDLEMLGRIEQALVAIDPTAVNSIRDVSYSSYATSLREEHILRTTQDYNPRTGTYNGFMERRAHSDEQLEIQYVPAARKQMLSDIINNPPRMTHDSFMNSMFAISVMDNNHMLEADGALEEGGKLYSHKKSAACLAKLKGAVERRNLEEIRQAEKEYQDAMKLENQIFYRVSQFGKNAGIPDNLDTIRNKAIPPQFAFDMVTDSRMNGLYLVGMAAKSMGVPVTEYVENPGRTILRSIRDKMKPHGFDSVEQVGMSFTEAVETLYELGRNVEKDDTLQTAAFGSVMSGESYVKRAIGGLYTLETDPETQKELLTYQKKIAQLADSAVAREMAYTTCIYRMMKPDTLADQKSLSQLKEGLKMAFLEGTRIRKDHLPLTYVGADGVEKERPAAYRDILKQKDLYEKLTNMYKRNLQDARNTDLLQTKEIIQETLFDYLKAHPEDQNKSQYKDLEKLALGADRDLQMRTPENEAERAATPKARYLQWKQDFRNEMLTMEHNLRTADLEMNNRFSHLQQNFDQAMAKNPPNLEDAWKHMDDLRKTVMDRQKELVESWYKREITNSYFTRRYKDLQTMFKNPYMNPVDPPKLVSTDPVQREADLTRINRVVTYSFGTSRFTSMDKYREWKLSQPGVDRQQLELATELQWKQLYHNDLYQSAKQNTSIPQWMKDMQNEAEMKVQRIAAKKARQLAALRDSQNARGPVRVVKNKISKTITKKIEKGK